MLALLLCAAARQNLFGGFGAQHQNTADPVGRHFVVNGAERICPVTVLQFSVLDDGNELILVPGRTLTAQHQLDLGPDDRPDFRPGRSRWSTEDRRMLFGTE